MGKKQTFKELGVTEAILDVIKEKHITEPTEIQAKTIPLILAGKDVIGGSKTGSGKTLAFACGIIKKTKRGMGIQSLVLVPTRELAEQVADAIKEFSRRRKMNIVKVYGGISINPQISNLRQADVVVATPGRLLDHINRNTINLRAVKILVLDEADLMADMGFLRDVEKIILAIPKKRQTLLFSATVSGDIRHLEARHMHNPVKISVEKFVDAKKLEQTYIDVSTKEKFSLLVQLLHEERSGLVMVFCNTRRNTDFVAKNLKANGIDSCAIHGGLTQNKRKQILDDFHKGKTYALICTDVAARGLDIGGVSHVYNYDVCKDAKQYIHRIGRTARAGKNGRAITLLSERDHENFSKVDALNEQGIQQEPTPHIRRANIAFIAPKRQFGGRRPANSGRGHNPRRSKQRPSKQNKSNSAPRRRR
jgi:ATP-dependent RNA helicase DeaD